jgi:DNA transposition AAA+ family ATPase
MDYTTVQTKNLTRVHDALGKVKGKSKALPGICLVYGGPGTGKTTAVESIKEEYNAIFLTAHAGTNFSNLLKKILQALGGAVPHRNADRVDAIIDALKMRPRPLFIDEADFLFKDARMIEVLRGIHDAANVPVLLIGMDGIKNSVLAYPQLSSRVSQRVEFKSCTLREADLIAKSMCVVTVAPDLVELMHKQTGGNFRLIVIALSGFEAYATGHGMKSLNAEQWAGAPMFLTTEVA